MTITVADLVRVRPPPVPVTVKESLPSEELELVLIVSVEVVAEEDTEVGEKEPVVPDRRPETLSDTEEVNPPDRLMVTLYVLEEPRVTLPLDGETDNEKSGAALTTTVTDTVRVMPPPVPVTVKESLPSEELELVLIVSVEVVAEEDTEVGEKEPVVPDRRPETLSDTEEVNPPDRPTVTLYVLEDPRVTLPLHGENDNVKLGCGTAVTTTVSELDSQLLASVFLYPVNTYVPAALPVPVQASYSPLASRVGHPVMVCVDPPLNR